MDWATKYHLSRLGFDRFLLSLVAWSSHLVRRTGVRGSVLTHTELNSIYNWQSFKRGCSTYHRKCLRMISRIIVNIKTFLLPPCLYLLFFHGLDKNVKRLYKSNKTSQIQGITKHTIYTKYKQAIRIIKSRPMDLPKTLYVRLYWQI